ncbi:DUF4276 family protein [Lyngbya sp. CCY1209]|jgi:hypothetical protein|uniref:DUF4276 family protein n=1 Tax=Lyngbya sp. CCY1209 TaxID=2886103 RepID=UPI0035C8E727
MKKIIALSLPKNGCTGGGEKQANRTWEALERVLKRAGYHKGGLEKYKASGDIAQHMTPEVNRSQSFQVFYRSLLELTGNNCKLL